MQTGIFKERVLSPSFLQTPALKPASEARHLPTTYLLHNHTPRQTSHPPIQPLTNLPLHRALVRRAKILRLQRGAIDLATQQITVTICVHSSL